MNVVAAAPIMMLNTPTQARTMVSVFGPLVGSSPGGSGGFSGSHPPIDPVP